MKRIAILFCAAVLSAGPSGADSGWGVMGSYWNAGDWGDTVGVGGKISFELFPNASLDLRSVWYDDLEPDLEGGADASVEMVPVELGFAIGRPVGPVTIYGGAGIGYYFLDGDVQGPGGESQDADFDNELGYYLTLGGEFTLSEDKEKVFLGSTRITLFAELFYRSLSVDSVDVSGGGEYDVGEDLAGLGVNVGLMVRW
jgi:hypothetical protein